jgi:hypothetical protein
MKCKHWKYLLPDYASGTLEEEDVGSLEAHLAVCSDCREEAARFRTLFSTIYAENLNAPSQTEWNNFLVHVHEKIERKNTNPITGQIFLRLVLPAAVCVLLIVAGSFAWRSLKVASMDLSLKEEISKMVSQLEPAQLAAIEIPAAVDPSLPDIPSTAALESDLSESLNAHVTDQLFSDISESDLYSAGSDYILPRESSPFYDNVNALVAVQDFSLDK